MMWPEPRWLGRIVDREITRTGGRPCRCRRCTGRCCGGRCCGGGCQGACGCRCLRCGGAALADEASAARRATRAASGGAALPGWGGWTPPVPLSQLIGAGGTGLATARPPELARFFQTGRPQVYRITRAGIDRARPLYIGMVELNNSIAGRVRQHYRDKDAGQPDVRRAIKNLPAGQILVQAARLTGVSTVAAGHVYEGWLSMREQPLIYDSSHRFFDEADHAN